MLTLDYILKVARLRRQYGEHRGFAHEEPEPNAVDIEFANITGFSRWPSEQTADAKRVQEVLTKNEHL